MWDGEKFVDNGGECALAFGMLLDLLVEILAFIGYWEVFPPVFVVYSFF
jgi:hypothetical protein